jgi:galactofuranose transport system ATP-binding protein
MADQPILEVRDVTKHFSGVVALEDVSFALEPGEVHALVGENGAGKSTLIKVLTGVHRPDEGEVRFDGEPVSFSSPRAAQDAGISTIYQEIDLIPLRTVAQNIFLGREPRTKLGLTDPRRMRRESAEVLERYGLDVDPNRTVRSLGLGIQQMVAIAKAVSREAKVVIMDEPTSSLEGREVQRLFDVIGRLRDDGVAVLYVSHRLDELYELCERVTVLRDGRLVHTGALDELPRLELIAQMLGREVAEVEEQEAHVHHGNGDGATAGEEPILVARELSDRPALHGVSVEVRRGETVGLAGLMGSGRTETAKAIFGAEPPDDGTVEIEERPVKLRSPADAVPAGLAFLPEDRKADGIFPGLSIRENIIAAALPQLSKRGVVSRAAANKLVDTFMERLNIKASSPDQPVGELSGGNQQKVLLARCLCTEPKILILDEPTRGIDVGAKAEVQGLISELSEQGLAVLMISSEPEEVVRACDRVVVLHDGAVAGTLSGEELTEDRLVETIAGGREPQDGSDGR